jgi:hypothetical protein
MSEASIRVGSAATAHPAPGGGDWVCLGDRIFDLKQVVGASVYFDRPKTDSKRGGPKLDSVVDLLLQGGHTLKFLNEEAEAIKPVLWSWVNRDLLSSPQEESSEPATEEIVDAGSAGLPVEAA